MLIAIALLLIVLNGIEMFTIHAVRNLDTLLIVLNGIEIRC